MEKQLVWGGALLAALLCVAGVATALMPPHTKGSQPKDGDDLEGRTVIFYGYSLDYADKKADVLDLRRKQRVPATVEVSCSWEGKGDCPGCQQQRCEARVTLARVRRDHRYRVTYLDATITVRAVRDEAAAPAPAPLNKGGGGGPRGDKGDATP